MEAAQYVVTPPISLKTQILKLVTAFISEGFPFFPFLFLVIFFIYFYFSSSLISAFDQIAKMHVSNAKGKK